MRYVILSSQLSNSLWIGGRILIPHRYNDINEGYGIVVNVEVFNLAAFLTLMPGVPEYLSSPAVVGRMVTGQHIVRRLHIGTLPVVVVITGVAVLAVGRTLGYLSAAYDAVTGLGSHTLLT